MKLLVVDEAGVRALLPMRDCIPVVRDALMALSRGEVVLPLRSKVNLPDGTGLLGLMPAYLGAPQSFGLKVVTVMPGNHGTAFDSHQGVVMLFGVTHGEPLVIADGSAITAVRTAAASAVATDLLALPDAGDLAILGSGVQARSHLAAIREVRRLRRVRVWSRSQAHAERFAAEESGRMGMRIEAVRAAADAVRGADLICTTTAAREPVLHGSWLAPGAHVNAVGACFPASRELDAEAVRRARFFTDCRESCLHEAGDFLIACSEGAITAAHLLGDVGEVALGRVPGRTAPTDITIFESLGVAVEDLAAAHFIHRRALESGHGQWLEWGGPRQS